MHADDLVALLRGRAERQGDDLCCAFLVDGEHRLATLTYTELDAQARRVASLLAERMAPGSRAVLAYGPGLEFAAAFFGCLYAGVVAVPVVPPLPSRREAGLLHIQRILADCRGEAVLTTAKLLPPSALDPGRVRWMATDGPGDARAWQDPGVDASTVAFLQYSSGSTSDPKGVVVTHANLLANQRAIAWSLGIPDDAVVVTWLPMYHDMGLIGTLLQPIYRGAPCYLLSAHHFLRRPARWLEAISRFRGVMCGAPNFAYDLLVQRVTEEERAHLDLSSWSVAFCGAEPIRAATVRRFQELFAPHGFSPTSLVGCYGLAEATLLVAGARSDDQKVLTVGRQDLERGVAVAAPAGTQGTVELVSCGRVQEEHRVAVVDPETCCRLAPGQVGEIWFAGPSVGQGYWNRRDESAATFAAELAEDPGRPYLRTGDLGFVRDGQVYVTGRRKDLLIVRGRNVHPHDIEDTAQFSDERLRRGYGTAFAVDTGDEETVALIQETATSQPDELESLARTVRQAVLETHEVVLAEVFLVPPRSILKTSSGKVRRGASRDALLAGDMTVRYGDRGVLGPSARVPV